MEQSLKSLTTCPPILPRELSLGTNLFIVDGEKASDCGSHSLKRGSDGKFSDDDLAEIIQAATAEPAGAFRGRGTPTVLRLVEIMGIEQSRAWGLCTMNEFRKFLGLRRTWADGTSDEFSF